ncbi:glycosyltransferase, partial [Candidatus Uhrbacteria bacterium]|nr:glycosyltransferase [Candidatus Uhrbacteria bacterium]
MGLLGTMEEGGWMKAPSSSIHLPLSSLHQAFLHDEISVMRIAIDARMMGPMNTRGIGRFIEELVRAMIEQNSGHTFILLVKDSKKSPFLNRPGVEHVQANIHWYGFAEQFRLPQKIRHANADLLFVPHWNITWRCPIPRVVFIHDLILLEEPLSATITTRSRAYAWLKRRVFYRVLRRALFTSRKILVPLIYTKSWIHQHFPNLKTPIEIVGEGMPDPDPSVWKEPDPDDAYLLMVGSAYPHKNHRAVFEAWKELTAQYPDVKLNVVGKKDAFMERLIEEVEGQRPE